MKLKKILPVTAMIFAVLMGSCSKEDNRYLPSSPSGISSTKNPTALPSVVPPVDKSTALQAKIVALKAVNLGVAGNFVVLSKTGITDVYKSAITGNIGTSPITGAALLVSCTEVAGTIYTVDAAGPLPCRVTSATMLTTAIGDMQAAYTDAAGRSNPAFLNLGAGTIGGLTLSPGLYKWTSEVVIPTDVTISGGPNDVWIF
jgi:hypothetical protein